MNGSVFRDCTDHAKSLSSAPAMLKMTRSNWIRWAALLWFAAWLVVVLPGHERGALQAVGGDASSQAGYVETGAICGVSEQPLPWDRGGPEEPVAPTTPSEPHDSCVICVYLSQLASAPPCVIYTPCLGELDELVYASFDSISDDLTTPSQLRGRPPPA